MNFMKINLEIKNKILILIYKINIYGSLNNNHSIILIINENYKIYNHFKN